MSQSVDRGPYLLFLMSVSLFGLFLVGALSLNPPTVQESIPWRKPVVGSIFASICVMGALAALFPKHCSRGFHFEKEETRSRESKLISYRSGPSVRGHHPDCGNFSAHVFWVSDRTFCTSCTGLLTGALIALVGTVLYFFSDWHISQEVLLAVGLGILGVGFGLLQFSLFKNRRSLFRFLFNVFFVLGAFLILIGIDTLVRSLAVDLFLVLLSLFWIFTRISLSEWDHKRICRACDVNMCEFRR